VRQLFDGAACLVRGLGIFAGTPGLWVIGLVPAFLALLVLIGLLVGLVVALPGLVDALTPFARAWTAADRDALRLLLELVIAVGAVWLAMVSYTLARARGSTRRRGRGGAASAGPSATASCSSR
jgi:CysZ protein